MRQSPAFFVIVDISGYTRFVNVHRMAMVHAEQIITELLEGILDRKRSPLVLDKLQGDAAIFYAPIEGTSEVARTITEQVLEFFEAFKTREAELVSCNVCICDACNKIDGLQLKAILHHGEVIIKEMGGSTELGGHDIIYAHRLLKNHVQADEYVLMSEPFHALAGDLEGMEPHRQTRSTRATGRPR